MTFFIYSKQHPNKHQEYFEIFRKLKHNEVFTDVTFVTKLSKTLSIHRVVLATYSNLFKSIFQEITSLDNHCKILLPDIEYSDVEALCHILYGVDVAVPRSRLLYTGWFKNDFSAWWSYIRYPKRIR